ncbi:hypothetical protein ACFQZC_22310 [Streptacidiphilus monticola]
MAFDVVPVTADRWAELAEFFGPSGAYSNCWCAFWRLSGKEFSAGCAERGAGNRALLERLTREGREPGLLAYEEGQPVGWAGLAPRPEYARVLRSPTLKPGPQPVDADDPDRGDDPDDPGVWAVTCFWIPRPQRGRGRHRAAGRGGGARAGARGTGVGGLPGRDGGAKGDPASLYTGTAAMFRRAGFREVRKRKDTRPVMRLAL